MSGKHVAEDAQCDAICKGVLAKKWGYVEGTRCAGVKGHSILRNGVGHYFPKRPGGRKWTAPSKGGYQGIVTDQTPPHEKRVPPCSPASSAVGGADE